MELGKETVTQILQTELIQDVQKFRGKCHSILAQNRRLENNVEDALILFKNATNDCYFCYDLIVRSANVIQYRRSQCGSLGAGDNGSTICNTLVDAELETGFVRAREDYSDFNCKSILEGIYAFDYRIVGNTGLCSSPFSTIKACQRQGSPLRDNSVFEQTFGYCPNFQDVSILEDPNIVFGKANIWRCYGRWTDRSNNIWAAIAYDTNQLRFKYRCLTTRIDQQNPTDLYYWGMSTDADCKVVHSYQTAPIRLELRPAFDPETQLAELQPGCKLPTNFSGAWFYPSEYQTTVVINSTHIFMKRKRAEFVYDYIYFVCRQQQESRYLMSVVTLGKWEACQWSSFTLNYIEWTYEYFIQDPPVPINCPIQGKFKFIQRGQEQEKYDTKIPGGMTPRPWLQVLCYNYWQSNIQACLQDPKTLQLDVQKCWRLDFAGQPISEYNVVDNYITCVGFWMEDTKSFLITHDKQDPVTNNFRCWVYKRVGFRNYLMSRGRGNQCSKIQTAESSLPEEGASLLLELTEDELQFDVCPMSWDDGRNPYASQDVLDVYGVATHKGFSTHAILLSTIPFPGGRKPQNGQ
ncbi:hypothetical protein T265_00400 [Opisthorchis viverrini]|uniref:Uncharacterized protein n=1 Tax=Opisthorchis viverrini TaxID=6198 RepID=A0A075A5Z1_OPIVI|nr:hypothetical protein T265_00400 [Opisthorchis viverrini]KER33712.1 hypothetical protein T265_00400 [Opisthorchis viverrini]